MQLIRKLPLVIIGMLVVIGAGALIIDGANVLGLSEDTAELARGGFILTLLRAVVALAAMFVVLRWFDLLQAFDFKGWMKKAADKGDFRAISIYFGARLIGVCLLLGIIFS